MKSVARLVQERRVVVVAALGPHQQVDLPTRLRDPHGRPRVLGRAVLQVDVDGRRLEEGQPQRLEGPPHRGLEALDPERGIVLRQAPDEAHVRLRAPPEPVPGRLHARLDPGAIEAAGRVRDSLELGSKRGVVDLLEVRPEAHVGVVSEPAQRLHHGCVQLQSEVVCLLHDLVGPLAQGFAARGVGLARGLRDRGVERHPLAPTAPAEADLGLCRGVEAGQPIVLRRGPPLDDPVEDDAADALLLLAGRGIHGRERLLGVEPGVALDDRGRVLLRLQARPDLSALVLQLVAGIAKPSHDLFVGHGFES